MSKTYSESSETPAPGPLRDTSVPLNRPDLPTILKHLFLFVLTFISVSYVSTFLVGTLQDVDSIGGIIPIPVAGDLHRGVIFASLLLSFLTVHEFGHYFAAVYHKVRVSLPYYIPIPLGIGTLGAVIRIREEIRDTRKLFDIGAAGPIAGFIVSLLILFYGFFTLPEPEFLNEFGDHSDVIAYFYEYGEYPAAPAVGEGQMVFYFGQTPLFGLLSSLFQGAPPMWELQHYPFLLAGWFGLFFTALNLMPVGQLDGGHILYSLIGYRRHRIVARLFFAFVTILAGLEAVPIIHETLLPYDTDFGMLSWLLWILALFLILNKAYHREREWVYSVLPVSVLSSGIYLYVLSPAGQQESSLIWLVWALFIAFVVKVEHPPALIEKPLTPGRKVLGWLSMIIFILCISLNPLSFK